MNRASLLFPAIGIRQIALFKLAVAIGQGRRIKKSF